MNEYDSVVIGAGIAGCIAARELAETGNKKVLVVEKRDHIGGNCYDLRDEYGVLIHQYGPHIFHTQNMRVFEYLSRFTEWHRYDHEVVANVHGRLIPVPFNLNTLHMVFSEDKAVRIEEKLTQEYGREARVPILELIDNEDEEVRQVAQYVYENIFLHYSMKQWGQKPEEIDPSVTARVPVLISKDNRYFQDLYQGMPRYGYTAMFEKVLDHPNITLLKKQDGKDILTIENEEILIYENPFAGEVIYTGSADELMEYRFGKLPYRSLEFVFEHFKEENYQGHSVVNYTVSEDFTRITEFKHFTGDKLGQGTTIVKEYPRDYAGGDQEVPCYAILNEVNQKMYQRYTGELNKIKNLYMLGRLAEYKYYNMDVMVEKALELTERILEGRK